MNSDRALSRRTTLAGLVVGLSSVVARRALLVEAQSATPAATAEVDGDVANINGADLYYLVRGDEAGPPVLLLHGGIGNLEDWRFLSPALVAAGYRVVAMDCRGRGRSEWGDLPITYEQMAADALSLLDLLEIDQVNFVGWSDGAILGLELAITHPERLYRTVIYGANYTPNGNYPDGPHASDQLPPFEQFIADYQRLSPQPERFDELMGVMGALWAVAPNYSDAQLGSIAVPVLILDGADEEFVKPEHTVRMAELIPGAELVVMPDTGHFAPFAKTAEFNRIVLAFLAGEQVGTPVADTPNA